MTDNTDITLATPQEELQSKLLAETNPDEMQKIVDIFNLNILKKNIVRNSKLGDLQDKIYSQMEDRITKKSGEFSNKDLLDYFKVIQETIDKSDNMLDTAPAIQITQNQLNIKADELTADSRQRVANAVQAILNNYNFDEIEGDVVDESNINDET